MKCVLLWKIERVKVPSIFHITQRYVNFFLYRSDTDSLSSESPGTSTAGIFMFVASSDKLQFSLSEVQLLLLLVSILVGVT